ncbi:tubulin epsilon chain [Orussus abietinus]|uniref:tubulin epsilon chain n=1 Tax=Orussus abietinus TaxID=222816 RepID=UPI0006257CDF|nr:tubulin epsilon chain [Orussus abietinus]
MSQFITVQVGQCGNQIGAAFWPLALHEYGIQTSCGGVNLLKTQRDHIKNFKDVLDAFDSFFYVPNGRNNVSFNTIGDLNEAKVKARAILVDMEDSVISRFKQGPMRGLFDQTCFVANYPGSGNNWAIGHYTHGREYRNHLRNAIRLSAEKCDQLHGFIIVHSLGGGTGSGLGTATLKLLNDDYPLVDRFVSCVYPAGSSDVVTAPYNVLLSTHELVEHATCVFPAENKALMEICSAQMEKKENADQAKYNAICKPYHDINSVIVNMLLHLTSGSRFSGNLNVDMNELVTNLVAYPQLHYIFSSVSPVTLTAPTRSMVQGSKMFDELFTNAWARNNQLIKVDPLRKGSVILGAAHIARGNPSLTDIRRNILRFQSKADFTPWSKDIMKVGLCSVPPSGHTASLICLLNSSAMSSVFKNIVHEFNRLYQKKAHTHHYIQIEGFEEGHFEESRECITSLAQQYTEVQNQKPMNISRLQLI